ncbi:FtsK/SpoIIIE domain-containing protein [Virgibacillus sp. DJP39]|uniref:FtsK/SpoIIIE domain-containing protein n=1 Tax=Virgibacillus sp. DJP39 TaxID=3409790 RepID=UPI003BB4F41F
MFLTKQKEDVASIELLGSDLFGVEYNIIKDEVKDKQFIPNLLLNNNHASRNAIENDFNNFNAFEVSLVQPFFLPLKTSLNGLYKDYLIDLSKILKGDELVSVFWIFQKRGNWKEKAVDMYKSYLSGNETPSDINLLRKLEDKLFGLINKISPSSTEYCDDVEKKILDDGYSFQCIIEVKSERCEELLDYIEGMYEEYDFYNGLRLESIKKRNPYVYQKNNQILSQSEITSLLFGNKTKNEVVEWSEVKENNGGENILREKVKLLPVIKKDEIEKDDNIPVKLAEALKRVGIINQARLYNESINMGSRLTIIKADIPTNKNFSDIEKKKRDIQASLGVKSLGIEMGDEANSIKYSIPHKNQQLISLREVIDQDSFKEFRKDNFLAFCVGKDEIDNCIYLDLKKLVHLLICGTTGSGKSVFLNSLITTLLLTHTQNELELILIDPKQVELQQYQPFPHVSKVITDMERAEKTFKDLVDEMERRYTLFKENKVKSIEGYNQKNKEKMKFKVCVIEEYADLFSVVGKKIEEYIMRLGQKSRAAGIHLIICTQRPSSNILSSNIQANIQNAISFNLGNNTNYRTIFGKGIPYELIGRGDGVMRIEGYEKEFQRFQSPIISANEIEESEFYERLGNSYEGENDSLKDIINEKETGYSYIKDPTLEKLKTIISNTKKTKMDFLREEMNIKMSTLSELMNELVKEGWLLKHKSRSKGYELVVGDNTLKEYFSKESV